MGYAFHESFLLLNTTIYHLCEMCCMLCVFIVKFYKIKNPKLQAANRHGLCLEYI